VDDVRTTMVLVLAGLALLAGCGDSDEPDEASVEVTDEMLLVAGEMPAWNSAGTWVATDDTDVLRACPLPDAASLGATVAIGRTFTYEVQLAEGETADPDAPPMLGLSAAATYPDAATAQAAVDAWVAALQECDAVEIGTVDRGSTWTTYARDDSSDEGWFDVVGVAAEGSSTAMVAFSLYGQDANYEGDPLAASLQTAATRLG
jgi:hypothetical protein